MKNAKVVLPLAAASGRTISVAHIVNDGANVHGLHIVFTDGTELSIDFYPQIFNAEISHFRWNEAGEVVEVTED